MLDPEHLTALKLGYPVDDLPHLTGFSRSTCYNLVADGRLPAKRLGKRIIVLRNDLEQFLRGLPSAA